MSIVGTATKGDSQRPFAFVASKKDGELVLPFVIFFRFSQYWRMIPLTRPWMVTRWA